MNKEGKLYALLATARIANVPSVVSNLGVGVLLGSLDTGENFSWPWLLTLAAVLFYVGGNFLNDFRDRDWDMENRPERALPRGLFSAKTYFLTAIACFGIGLVICGFSGWRALVIAVALVWLIVWYTEIHKRTPLSVIPMGLCRACLPVLGYVGVREGFSGAALLPAAALLLYIIALSLSARFEARGDMPLSKRRQATGMLVGAGVLASLLPLLVSPALGWIGLVPFGIWMGLSLTKYRSPVPAHVSALLAGIPLVDWVTLLPMALIWMHLERVEAFDPMFSVAVFLSPAAFVLGRLLQRVAPAT